MKHSLPGILCITMIFSLVSCKKTTIQEQVPVVMEQDTPISGVATYKLIITGEWKMPQHTVPAGNHFTKFVGMVHGSSTRLWQTGTLASLGLENVAEVGNDAVLQTEMDAYIANGKALNKFSVVLPGITSKDSTIINLDIPHSLISFGSMIAPSPDWFAGIDSYDLIQNGKWVTDITVNIYGYDAGTEDGNVFGYNNPATVPQQNICLLTPLNAGVISNGNPTIAHFATLRLIRQ